MLSKTFLLVGLCSLVHAAFSAAQYRSYLRVSEQPFTGSLPVDIILQTVFSLLVTIASLVGVQCGHFKVIQADNDFAKKRYDQVFGTQNSFFNFNHRGRLLCSVNAQRSEHEPQSLQQ